jgi:hypothetical protein
MPCGCSIRLHELDRLERGRRDGARRDRDRACASSPFHAARAALFRGLYDHRRESRLETGDHVRLLNPEVDDDADATTRRFAQVEIDEDD